VILTELIVIERHRASSSVIERVIDREQLLHKEHLGWAMLLPLQVDPL